MEGQATLLWDTYNKSGLKELCPLEFVLFDDIGASDDISDREVWHLIQYSKMLLLTDNRSDNDKDSLE